jgi:hypothetical protein
MRQSKKIKLDIKVKNHVLLDKIIRIMNTFSLQEIVLATTIFLTDEEKQYLTDKELYYQFRGGTIEHVGYTSRTRIYDTEADYIYACQREEGWDETYIISKSSNIQSYMTGTYPRVSNYKLSLDKYVATIQLVNFNTHNFPLPTTKYDDKVSTFDRETYLQHRNKQIGLLDSLFDEYKVYVKSDIEIPSRKDAKMRHVHSITMDVLGEVSDEDVINVAAGKVIRSLFDISSEYSIVITDIPNDNIIQQIKDKAAKLDISNHISDKHQLMLSRSDECMFNKKMYIKYDDLSPKTIEEHHATTLLTSSSDH